LKKKLILIPLLVLVLLASMGTVMSVSADGTPTIDGVIDESEWDGALEIPVADEMSTVSIIAYADYLYVLFDVVDSNDARIDYEFEVGNDQISININPTDGGAWGFPYDLIFETSALLAEDGGHHWLPWNPKVNSGTLDGWATRWFPDNAQEALPDTLESATVYSGGKRITEWKIPLATTALSLKVGGAVDVGDGNSYVYPIGLDWNDPETFETCEVIQPPPPVRSPNAFDVFVRFGYDSTRYGSDGALISSIEAAGEYNDARYMLGIPEGCVVTGTAGRINWLFLTDIDGDTLSFLGGDASFSEPCTLYIAKGGRIYQDYWTGDWLGGTWVEVGTFTSIVDGEAHLN